MHWLLLTVTGKLWIQNSALKYQSYRSAFTKRNLDRSWYCSQNPIYVHPVERAGQSVQDKIAAIRQKMEDQHADVHIISSLDDVAWTLNLRGSDVQSNPVFLGYIVLSKNDAILFTIDLENWIPRRANKWMRLVSEDDALR